MTSEELFKVALVCLVSYGVLFVATGLTKAEEVRAIKDFLLSLTVVFLLAAICLK